ncbi:hypothetical protein FQZ97_336490 [compost metagenome]
METFTGIGLVSENQTVQCHPDCNRKRDKIQSSISWSDETNGVEFTYLQECVGSAQALREVLYLLCCHRIAWAEIQ